MCSAVAPDSRTSALEIRRPTCRPWAACRPREGTSGSTDCTSPWSRRCIPPAERSFGCDPRGRPRGVWPGSRLSLFLIISPRQRRPGISRLCSLPPNYRIACHPPQCQEIWPAKRSGLSGTASGQCGQLRITRYPVPAAANAGSSSRRATADLGNSRASGSSGRHREILGRSEAVMPHPREVIAARAPRSNNASPARPARSAGEIPRLARAR